MNKEIKLNLGAGPKCLDGFINMDKSYKGSQVKWFWEDQFSFFKDGSVDAITISQTMFCIDEKYYPNIFTDLFRIMKPNGVIRITENDTEDPKSWYYNNNGFIKTVLDVYSCFTKTGPKLFRNYLEKVGFKVYDVNSDFTNYKDKSLIQRWDEKTFRKIPNVFYMEAIKL